MKTWITLLASLLWSFFLFSSSWINQLIWLVVDVKAREKFEFLLFDQSHTDTHTHTHTHTHTLLHTDTHWKDNETTILEAGIPLLLFLFRLRWQWSRRGWKIDGWRSGWENGWMEGGRGGEGEQRRARPITWE